MWADNSANSIIATHDAIGAKSDLINWNDINNIYSINEKIYSYPKCLSSFPLPLTHFHQEVINQPQ